MTYMTWTSVTIFLILIWANAPVALGGDVLGKITITKRLTPKRVLLAAYERRGAVLPPVSAAGSKDGGASASESEMDRVVVYLEGPKDRAQPERVVLNQKGKRFDREIVAVPLGSTVSFPNLDPIFHNVFSLSRIKAFDLGYYGEGKSREVTFEKPGVVTVYCHLHPNMSAAIVVTPNAWTARPDSGGEFHLRGVPAGSWKVVVWHKSAGHFRSTVDVTGAGTAGVAFEIPVQEGATR